MDYTTLITILKFIAISTLFIGVLLFAYWYNRRFYLTGLFRGKQIMKRFGKSIIEKISEGNELHDRVTSARDEVYRMVVKPSAVTNAEECVRNIETESDRVRAENTKKKEWIKREYEHRASEVEKNFHNRESELNHMVVSSKEKIDDQTKTVNEQINNAKRDLGNLRKRSDEIRKEFKFDLKIQSVLNSMAHFYSNVYRKLSKTFLNLLPILFLIALVIVDYAVGTGFIHEQRRAELEASEGLKRIFEMITIYGVAFMIFSVVVLAIEYARKGIFDVYKNFFVSTIKWLTVAFFGVSGFAGIMLYYGGTRFFPGNIQLQNILEDIGLILIWFLVAFIASLLFNEINKSKLGFNPLAYLISAILVFPMFLVIVFLLLLVVVEYLYKMLFIRPKLPLNQISQSQAIIDDKKRELARKERKQDDLQIKYEELPELKEEALSKLKTEKNLKFSGVRQKLEGEVSRLEAGKAKYDNIVLAYREGCQQAVIKYWQ